MKKLTLWTFALLIGSVVYAQDAPQVFNEPVDGPKIKFKENSFDFGEITQGDVVEHTFEFENVGTQSLVINDVRTTCGCTVPKWPREPLAPGESASMTVQFSSRGKVGMQNKVITVISNSTSQQDRVMIKTNILMPETR